MLLPDFQTNTGLVKGRMRIFFSAHRGFGHILLEHKILQLEKKIITASKIKSGPGFSRMNPNALVLTKSPHFDDF